MQNTNNTPSVPQLPGYQSSGQNVTDYSNTMYGQNPGLSTSPQYQQLGQNIVNNPANQVGAQMGQQAATNNFNTGAGVTGAGTSLYPYATPILNAGFDPQNALYTQQFNQNRDLTNVNNAQAGLSTSPYGAGVVNQSDMNFNTNWENQQLGRMVTGAQGAEGLVGAGTSATVAGQGLQTPAGSQYSTAANSPYTTGMSTLDAVTNQGINAQQIPQQTIQDLLTYLGVGNQNQQLQLQGENQQFNQSASTLGGIASLGALAFL